MFSDTLKNAIRDVSGMIAGELQVGEDEDFTLILAETTLDAGRLVMNGHREAQEELRSLLDTSSWDAVLEEAKKYVCY